MSYCMALLSLHHVSTSSLQRLTATPMWTRGIQIYVPPALTSHVPPKNFVRISGQRNSSSAVYASHPGLSRMPPQKIISSPKTKAQPKLLVLHNPLSLTSRKILNEIHNAQKAWPNQGIKIGPPLDFDLQVQTRLPTTEELQDLQAILQTPNWASFLNTLEHRADYRSHPTNARSLLEVIKTIQEQERKRFYNDPVQHNLDDVTETTPNPDHPLFGTDRFVWPIVVCWNQRLVSLGTNGVKGVRRIFKKFSEMQTGVIVRTPKEIAEIAKLERHQRFNSLVVKEISPPEDATLSWFNETSPPVPARRTLLTRVRRDR